MIAYKGEKIALVCENITHSFPGQGTNHTLFDVDLKVIAGSIVGLVGPSGCGKSTLFRAIVGTHPPSSGRVLISENGSELVVERPSRKIGIVYQGYALMPFLTSLENVAFGLMLDQTNPLTRVMGLVGIGKWPKLKKQHREEAYALLEKVHLKEAWNKLPSELSGGMRQRIALAQALATKPKVLLLDEPFGALDEATREDLQKMLLELYHENQDAKARGEEPPYTIIIVTHALTEAIYVGDRVIGLSRYWDWKSEGHNQCPGATIVYDRVAPVFKPDEPSEIPQLIFQREEIGKVVFSPDVVYPREQFTDFWKERGQ